MAEMHASSRRNEGDRFIQELIRRIPSGNDTLDVVYTQAIEELREKRADLFFDELAEAGCILDETLLRNEDFLHCFTLTIKCAVNSRRREKIRVFARLLKSFLVDLAPADVDEYEDFLNILDELSYREIRALIILDRFSVVPRDNRDNDLMWTNKFWEKFESQLCQQLKMPCDEVTGFMNRIARTGCYEMYTGTYFDYTGGKGKLTPIYVRLKEFIQKRDRTQTRRES